MPQVSLVELKDRTERLVITDLAFQDPMLMFCELDISVSLFERHTDDWIALVDVEGPGIDRVFFEIAYILDGDDAHVASYRPLQYNPYTTRRIDNAA